MCYYLHMPLPRNISVRRDDSDGDVTIYTATTLDPSASATLGRDAHRVVGKIGIAGPRELPHPNIETGQLFHHVPPQVTDMAISEAHMPYGGDDRIDFVDDAMEDAKKVYGEHPIPHRQYEVTNPFTHLKQFAIGDDALEGFGKDVTKRRPILRSVQFDKINNSVVGVAGDGYTQLKFPGT